MTSPRGPLVVHVHDEAGLLAALRDVGAVRPGGRPVVVLVGGAAGMAAEDVEALADVLRAAVLPLLAADGAVVDGGTNSGVMRAAGQARSGSTLLIGVAAMGTIAPPTGFSTVGDAADVDPGHTHIVLVPGDTWGDESPWLSRTAAAVAGGQPTVTLLANGGAIAGADVERGIAEGRPVVVLAGSGRLADDIADSEGPRPESDAARIARSALTTVVDIHDLGAVRSAVATAISSARENP